jgi:hypothetical protein
VLLALCVIAFAVVFGRSAVGFGSALVKFGCLVVFVSSHWFSPAVLGDAYENRARLASVPVGPKKAQAAPAANHNQAVEQSKCGHEAQHIKRG